MAEPAAHHAEIESVIIDMAECCTDNYQTLVDWNEVHKSLDEAKIAIDRAVATWTVCLWLCAPPPTVFVVERIGEGGRAAFRRERDAQAYIDERYDPSMFGYDRHEVQ